MMLWTNLKVEQYFSQNGLVISLDGRQILLSPAMMQIWIASILGLDENDVSLSAPLSDLTRKLSDAVELLLQQKFLERRE